MIPVGWALALALAFGLVGFFTAAALAAAARGDEIHERPSGDAGIA